MRIKNISVALAMFAALFSSAALAQGTAKSKSILNSEVSTQLPDNTSGAITPSVVRGVLNDMIASWQQYAHINAQVGTSYNILGSDYGQIITLNNANPISVVAPQPTGSFDIFNFFIDDIGAGTVTLTATGGTINGAASFAITQNQSFWFVSDSTGTNYISFSLNSAAAAGANTQIQFNNSSAFGASANLTWVNPTLTIGKANTSTGVLAMNGGQSGTITITPQNIAGTATLTLPNTSGTLASTVSSPLSLNTTTGEIFITGAVGTVLGGVSPPAFTTTPTLGVAATTTGTLGIAAGAAGGGMITLNPISNTGTYNWNFPTTAGSSGQFLLSGGGGVAPMTWLPIANGAVVNTNSSGTPSLTITPTLGVANSTTGTMALSSGASNTSVTLAPASSGSGYTFRLPNGAGVNTQFLQTDGNGNTSWVNAAGGGTVTSITCTGGINCNPNPIVGAGTVTADIATNANIWAATANKVLDAGNVFNSAGGLTTLFPATVVTPDFNTGFNFTMTLTGNIAIGNPSNLKIGQTGCIMLIQDASGNRLITNYYDKWHFAGTTTPSLSTNGGAIDQLCYLVRGTGAGTTTPIMATMSKNY